MFDTISELTVVSSPSRIAATLVEAAAKFGFTALGINGLPPPIQGADPMVLAERAPPGFRELYIHERFYLVDHLCAYGRSTTEPFRFSEAPYDSREARGHRRFLEALQSFGIGKGITVPVGRYPQLPACVWLAGSDPELHDDAKRAFQLIGLFAAAKAFANAASHEASDATLTAREREVLLWTAQGKSAWEIGEILGVTKRTINAHVQAATAKLGAANKTQAVVIAILRRLIEI